MTCDLLIIKHVSKSICEDYAKWILLAGSASDAGPRILSPKKQVSTLLGRGGILYIWQISFNTEVSFDWHCCRKVCLKSTCYFIVWPKLPSKKEKKQNINLNMGRLQTELPTELEANAKCALTMHSLSTGVKSNLILCNGLRAGAAHDIRLLLC